MLYKGNKIGKVKFDTNCNNETGEKRDVVNHMPSAGKSYLVDFIWRFNESMERAFTITAEFFFQKLMAHTEKDEVGWNAAF